MSWPDRAVFATLIQFLPKAPSSALMFPPMGSIGISNGALRN
ncbi:hypothetical protein [Saccharopolyspora soli]|nr:hypothetical protein [Saccharopolyspora soli]